MSQGRVLWVGREIQPALRSWLLEDGAGALMWSPNTAQQVILPKKTADLWVCFGEIFWLHGQVCLHFDEVCLHMTNLVYIMTRFVYTYALMPNLPAYDKLCLHHDKVCYNEQTLSCI